MNRLTKVFWMMAGVALLAGGCAVVSAVRQEATDASANAADVVEPAPAPLAFVRSDRRLTTVDTEQAAMALSAEGAIASPDGSRVFRTSADATGAGERLRVLDPRTGDEIWSDAVRGGVEPRVASFDGSVVALMEPPTSTTGYPEGRTTTKVVIAPVDGSAQSVHRLHGNFEPEAFSHDAEHLFLLKYVPAEAPTGYVVRQLDLTTGEVAAVESHDIGPNDVMGGVARSQVMAPDGRRLYTLYSVLPGVPDGLHGTQHQGRAFVHVLDLDEKWAHCLQLPEPFGVEYAADGPLAISSDGDDLYVMDPDRMTGRANLVTVDTENLAPGEVHTGVTEMWPMAAAVGDDGLLHVAGSDQLTGAPHLQTIDTADMTTVSERTLGSFVGGVSVVDGGQLLLVQPERRRLLLTDHDGGDRRVIDLPGQDPVAVGPGSISLPGPRNVLECAC